MIKTITLSIFLVLFISGLSISQSKDEVRLGEGKDETGNTKVKEQSTPTSDQEQKSNTNNSTTERKRIEVKSEPPKLEKIENRQVKTNTQTTQTRTNTSNNNSNKTAITSEPVIKDNRDNSNSTTVINIKSDDRGNSGRENESTSQSGVVTIKPDESNNNSGPVDENTPQSGVVTIREEESNNHAGPVDENTPQSGVVTINNPEIIYTNEEPTITHSNPIPYVETNYDNSSTNTNNPIIIYNNGQYNYGNPYYTERPRDVIPKKYTEPDASFMLGALKTTTKYPERFNISTNPVQSGFQFGSRYNIHKIEDISMKGVANLGLNLIGSFNFGFASATDKLNYNDAGVDYDYTTNHYTFVGDLFSLSGNAEYKANVFEDRGIVLGMSVTFFNLGGAATYMSGGRYDEGIFGVVNILPFYLQPYAKLKFMGGTLGVGLQLNPYNFLEYRFGPDNFWGEGESGFHTNSSKISRYAIEAYFKF